MQAPSRSQFFSKEWREGWALVLSAAAGMAFGGPLVTFTMSLFIVPLEREFGWSRAAISSGMTVNAVIAISLSWLMGSIIDKVGPRRIALWGVVFFSIAFALLAMNSGSLTHWWLLWVLLAVAMLTVKPTVWLTAVAGRFEGSRGLALALTLCGSTLAGIVAPPYAGWLISQFGWRIAYIGLSALGLVIVFPALFLAFYGEVDRQRIRDVSHKNDRGLTPGVKGVAAREALRSATFIQLALACALSYFVISGTTIHLAPILADLSLQPFETILLMSVLGGAMLVGRLAAGFWLDRFDPKMFGFLCFGAPALGLAILLTANVSFVTALLAVVAIGIANGAELEIASFLIARHFGMRSFGFLLGTLLGLMSLMGGIAPVLFGYTHDRFGTYEPALWLAIPLSLASSLLMLLLRNNQPRVQAQLHPARTDPQQ